MEINTDEIKRQLKKHHGERVMHVIERNHLLAVPNILHILEFVGDNPDDVYSLIPVLKEIYLTPVESNYVTDQDPIALLNSVGYDAFVVETEEQKDSIKKYFRPNEELCTFRDPTRHLQNYIIHAVKRNAAEIMPSETPSRQDEYGTSVISIQISKQGGYISIKNRYNHSVHNPDATFNNNPDNIVPGLTNALRKYFDVEFGTTNAEIPHNFRLVHDQFIKFNYEVENVYFGPNYYFCGSNIVRLDKNSEIMMDYFVLDKKNKKLLNTSNVNDPAFDLLKERLDGKNIRDEINPDNPKERIIFANGEKVASVMDGKITELDLPNAREIGDNFLQFNQTIRKINIPNVKNIGNNFLNMNSALMEFDAPSLESMGKWCLNSNTVLHKLNAPKLRRVDHFLRQNTELTEIWLPELEDAGDEFLRYNQKIKSVYLPNLQVAGGEFMMSNTELTEIGISQLKKCGSCFLACNEQIKTVVLPELIDTGNDFLRQNIDCDTLFVPKLKDAGHNFMCGNRALTSVSFPELETVGGFFLGGNENIESLYAPKLRYVDRSFMVHNQRIKHLDLPALENADGPLLLTNLILETANVPHLADERIKTMLMCKIANRKLVPQNQPEPIEKDSGAFSPTVQDILSDRHL